MHKRITLKDHTQEIRLINQRCVAVLILMGLLIVILIGRFAYLQLVNNDVFITLSKKNWLDMVPLEPTRGLIYDRNGVLLAENIPVYSLNITPYKIGNLPKTLSELSRIVPLSDNDIAQFHKQLKEHHQFDDITLKLRLTEQEVARFSENQYHFPGIAVKAHLLRHYPFLNSLSHILGYVGRINIDELKDIDETNYSASTYIGKLGIEKYYEEELHGTVGYEQAENDASGEAVRVLNRTNPLPGKNLYLTIDSKLQSAVEQALAGHRGAVIAIQPATGQVLALVSEPTYDPNMFVEGISSQEFQALQQAGDRPLYNRALRGLYPFASTIKPFIALEGLDSGVATLDYAINDPGWYMLPTSSHVFHDWRRHGHGIVNISRAIISSCDTYFFDLAHKLGIQRIDHMLEAFGFGEVTGIDMDEELPGVISSPAWKRRVKHQAWYEGDTLNSGIGQGFMQATPLQLAVGVATIANRGKHPIPHILLSEQEPGKPAVLAPVAFQKPVTLSDPKYWDMIISYMQGVIIAPGGTGYHFGKIGPYSVAAKTGTAQNHSIKHYNVNEDHENQSVLPEKLRDNSLFIAFAPVEKPQIALAVMVENDNVAASVVARKVLDYFFLGTPTTPPPAIPPLLMNPNDQGNNDAH